MRFSFAVSSTHVFSDKLLGINMGVFFFAVCTRFFGEVLLGNSVSGRIFLRYAPTFLVKYYLRNHLAQDFFFAVCTDVFADKLVWLELRPRVQDTFKFAV